MNPSKRIYKPGSVTPVNGAGNPGSDEDTPEPFPLDCLPPAPAAMAAAIAYTERTPETLAGCCCLGIMSASIGAGLQVKSGPNRTTRGNLFLMPDAESGSGKSETFRHAARPLQEFERAMVEDWRKAVAPKLESEKAMLESEISHLKKSAHKSKTAIEREDTRGELQKKLGELEQLNADMEAPALCTEDVTSERLAVLLASNQEQIASVSPDAGSIVNNLLGRYSKLDRTDESIYLKAFSGDYCRVDRQGRKPVLLQQPCLAALWLVQPDKIETLLGQRSLTDGGMIPRLLVCHTQAQPRHIVDGMEGIPATIADTWSNLVNDLLRTFRFASSPVTIEPTPDAREAMKAHFNSIVDRRLADLRDVTTYAARWNEQAWRIAVCLHAGLHGAGAGNHMMDLDTARRGIRLADWFAGEQIRILASGRQAAKRAKRDEVLKLLADKPAGVTPREVQRGLHLPSAIEARVLLADMEADGELTHTESKPETGGHVTLIYTKAQK